MSQNKIRNKKLFIRKKLQAVSGFFGFGSGKKAIRARAMRMTDGSGEIKKISAPNGWLRIKLGAMRNFKIKNIFAKDFYRRAGVVALLIIFLVTNFFQNSTSTQGATFLFTQTDWSGGATVNNATHPTNTTGWDEYSEGSNVTTNVAGQATLSDTTHENFSETFTADTFKDAANTTANWNTSGGQAEFPGELNGVDLQEKLNGFLRGNQVRSQVRDGDDFYVASSNAKFLKYNSVTETVTDLTDKISSFWSTNGIYTLAFDSTNDVIYLAGASGKFARYQTSSWNGSGTCAATSTAYAADAACDLTAKISSFWSTSTIYSTSFDSANGVLYLAGTEGKFARYQTSSWNGSGTCAATSVAYAADAGCDLTAKISSFWSTNEITKITLDTTNAIVYLAGSYYFAKYDIGSDTATNLSGKATAVLGTFNDVKVSAYADGKIYGGTDTGKFFVYDIDSGVSTDLTSRVSSFMSTSTIYAITYDSANKVIYLAGAAGKLIRYNTPAYGGGGTYADADTAYNLTTKISSFWSSSAIYSLAFDSADNVLYLGGQTGKLARYQTTSWSGSGTCTATSAAYAADAACNLTAKISSFWSTAIVYAVSFDSANKVLYLGGSSDKFARYQTSSWSGSGTCTATSAAYAADAACDLTAKVSSFSIAVVYSLTIDSANSVVYLGGSNGRFIRYQTSSWAGSGACAATGVDYAADAACNLTAKISSFFTTNAIYSLTFDSANNVVYLGGGSGKFVRYQTSSWAGSGTCAATSVAYASDAACNLTTQISAWGTTAINSLSFDSVNGVIYSGGDDGMFGKYVIGTETGSSVSASLHAANFFGLPYTLNSIEFDSTESVIYFGGANGYFVRYNPSSYSGGGTYPTADTAYNLSAKTPFAGDSVYSMEYDSTNKVVYLGATSGKFFRYQTTSWSGSGTCTATGGAYAADAGCNLTAKISSFWSASSGGTVYDILWDNARETFYLGGQFGKWARYNASTYSGGGTYPTANTAYDFSSKINGISWNASEILKIAVVSESEIYLAGTVSKFAVYNSLTGVVTDLSSKISSFFAGNSISGLKYDSVNKVVYLAGGAGYFVRYNTSAYAGGGTYPTADTAYDLALKISGAWGSEAITSMEFDSANQVVYLGGAQGKLIRYQTSFWNGSGTCTATSVAYASDAACNLTAKISSFWSTNQIYDLSIDSVNGVIYLGGAQGKFARYQTSSWNGSGTCAATSVDYVADAGCDLTAKISSFWSTNIIFNVNFDSDNGVIYLGGNSGKFARYQISSWSGSGTCAATSVAYAADAACDLTTKISSFWSTNGVYSAAVESASGVIYLGGAAGAFAKYSILTETASNLRSPDIISFWGSIQTIDVLALDENKQLYFGGGSGYFAEKPPLPVIAYAQSLTLDSVAYNVYYATLTKNDTVGSGTLAYQLSNDGGATWEDVTPGVNHQFSSVGSDLRFKIAITGNATVQDVAIEYWSVSSLGTLISSKYNTTDAANTLAKIQWSETIPAGTDVKFQVRTSADGNTWTAWCGPDDGVGGSCNSGTYFTSPTGTESIDDINYDQTNDQWIQYQAFLTSDGITTPTLSDTTMSYVVNAVPEVQNVSASQGSDGLVTVDYEIRDPDTTTGATQNSLAITLQYCTANCSNPGSETWTDAVTLSGDYGAGVSAQEVNWSAHQLVWTPTTDYNNQYNATDFKVRIKAYDGELANNTGYAQSGTFTLDTTDPTLAADTLLLNDSTTAITPVVSAITLKLQNLTGDTATETVYAQFSSDGATWYGANGNGTLATAGNWGTGFALNDIASLSWPWTMASRSETITVRIKDGYGNIQSSTDTNSSQYNAYPEIQSVTASQGSDGLVTVDYEIKDTDTTTGVTPNSLTMTLQYCTVNCSDPGNETWTDAVTATGDGAGISVTEDTWSAKQIVWTAATDYDEQYNVTDFKIRVKADDSDAVNNLDYAESAAFTLDTTDPTVGAFLIDHSENKLTINQPSDEGNYELYVANSLVSLFNVENKTSPLLNQGSTYPVDYTYASMTADPATVYVGVKDAKGNTSYSQTTTPTKPTNLVYYDISSPANSEFREFLAWNVIVEPAGGFASYKVYRSTSENGVYTLVDPNTAIITDRLTNYYLDRVKDNDPLTEDSDPTFDPDNPTTYYYKVVSTDDDGNISAFSTGVNDVPDGSGGTDSTAPIISNVVVSDVDTTSAVVTWETNEMSQSAVGYSTDYSYTPERGLSSFELLNHEINLTGLLPNTTYHINVQSQDAFGNTGIVCYGGVGCSPGSNAPEVFTFTTDPGPAISNVAVSSNNTQAAVSWVTTTDSDTYVVYSDTVTNGALVNPLEVGTPNLIGGSPLYNHSQMLTTYNDLPLISGETYYFYVKSTDATSQTAIDDNGGNFYSFTTTQDDDDPVISLVNEAIINDNKVAINWTTDEAATSVVNYGTTQGGPYTDTGEVLTLDKSHYVILTGLSTYTTYYYTVTSVDINSNSATSETEYSFQTLMNPEQQHDPLAALTDKADPANDLTDAGSVGIFAPAVLTDTAAVMDFETDQIAMCSIKYREAGQAYNPSDVIVETGYNTDHSMHIMSLILDTQYFYIIECVDNLPEGQAGSVTSQEFSFTTKVQQVDQHGPLTSITDIADPLPVFTNNKAVVTFNTDQAALCSVDFGTVSGDYSGAAVAETDYNGNHAIYLSGLTADTQYFYQISCADDLTNSVQSLENTFTTLQDPEFQHDVLSAISDITTPVIIDTKAVVAFNTDQAALCSVDFGTVSGDYSGTAVAETDYNGNHAIYLSGLTEEIPYFYQITCNDNLNTEVVSLEQTFTTSEKLYTASGIGNDVTAPVISGISAEVNSGESVTVSWTTDELASSYIQYSITSGTYTDMAGDPLVNYGTEADPKVNYSKTHAVIVNGLTPGIKYYFTAISHDLSGNIATSGEDTFTTGASSSLSSINITSASLGEALITWKTSAKTSSLVEYGLTETYGQKKEDNTAVTEHSITINGLTASQLYHLRVGGEDVNGKLYSSGDYTFTPKSPPQIGAIGVKDINEHGATISFTTDFPTEFTVTYTNLSDATDSGSKGKPDFSINHEITLDKLKPGTTYSLKVKSTDEQGNSVDKVGPNFTTGKDENAPEIKQTRTESALAQNDKVQTIISWETNELSTCKLVYREGSGGEEKEYKLSDRPTLSHVAVVTTFKSGTVYYFKIKSVDEAGNEATSSEYALLTPQKKENIVQIIVNNFQDIFSWTSRVGG